MPKHYFLFLQSYNYFIITFRSTTWILVMSPAMETSGLRRTNYQDKNFLVQVIWAMWINYYFLLQMTYFVTYILGFNRTHNVSTKRILNARRDLWGTWYKGRSIRIAGAHSDICILHPKRWLNGRNLFSYTTLLNCEYWFIYVKY